MSLTKSGGYQNQVKPKYQHFSVQCLKYLKNMYYEYAYSFLNSNIYTYDCHAYTFIMKSETRILQMHTSCKISKKKSICIIVVNIREIFRRNLPPNDILDT